MEEIYFIGEEYLKKTSPLSNNIDIDLLTPHISFAEKGYIQDILGSKFYNSLKLSYSAQTLNSYEVELMELIKPAIAYRTTALAIPYLNLQLRNKGVVKLDSENARQAELNEMKYLRESLESRAEFYEQKVLEYLNKNGGQFADYINYDSPTQPNKKSTYTCDLYLPDLGCGCGKDNCSCQYR